MTRSVYSRGVSFLYTFEILKWGKKDTYKKWKFRQKIQRHFIRPKLMGLQHIASTLSIRAYILIPELLVIKIFLRNIRVKKWCNELNFERSLSRVLNRNESYFYHNLHWHCWCLHPFSLSQLRSMMMNWLRLVLYKVYLLFWL